MHEEAEKFLGQVGRQFFSMFGLEVPDRKADFFTNEGDVNLNKISLKIFHSPWTFSGFDLYILAG